MESIAGGWLGTYAYGVGDSRPPVRFEATFQSQGDGFTGRILDDGELGEAQVEGGVQTGAQVAFVKRYQQRRRDVAPVHYQGALSEDGMALTGTWILTAGGYRLAGSWEARRLWWDEGQRVLEETDVQTLVEAR